MAAPPAWSRRAWPGAPRCGARTRAGHPCRAPAVKGKRRCRRHGGAAGSGAPRGNRNALKHGFYSRAAKAERRRLRALIREMERSLKLLE
ncbi:MAG: hypothetical protein OEO83_18305 [Alphaproteobacteria bacterium]|nr:hypothetical protein [Alphaproteobacteria bacterium]